ncbi:MAG: DUF1292 domain-containing protein [Clostridiales bacterium]|nr:DUF1292 domain-containing protein [Clostridiales bacterium]
MEKIQFQTDSGDAAEFFVEEQTSIAGTTYLLVSDSQEDEASAYIMRDVSEPDSEDACYVMVEDPEEFQAVSRIFEQMLENVDFEMEEKV